MIENKTNSPYFDYFVNDYYKGYDTEDKGMSTAIGSLIDGLFGLLGTGLNFYQQDKVNKENRDFATQMTTAQWERDDSSLQRQVKDALLAGLSPLAVTGAMNSSTPLNAVAQAPQMDLSSLIGLASSAGSQIESEKFQSQENEKDRLHQELMETKKLNAQVEQWNKENELEESEQTNELIKFNKSMIYQYDVLDSQNTQFYDSLNLTRLENISNQSLEQYKKVCESLGVTPKTQTYSDYSEYVKALSEFWGSYAQLALIRGSSDTSDKTTQQIQDNSSIGSNVAGVAGLSFSEGSTQSASVDMTRTNSYKDLSDHLSIVKFPIFIVGNDSYTKKKYKYNPISIE